MIPRGIEIHGGAEHKALWTTAEATNRFSGITIRFDALPEAREGTDFVVVDGCFLWKNKSALRALSVDVASLSALAYFKRLAKKPVTLDFNDLREMVTRIAYRQRESALPLGFEGIGDLHRYRGALLSKTARLSARAKTRLFEFVRENREIKDAGILGKKFLWRPGCRLFNLALIGEWYSLPLHKEFPSVLGRDEVYELFLSYRGVSDKVASAILDRLYSSPQELADDLKNLDRALLKSNAPGTSLGEREAYQPSLSEMWVQSQILGGHVPALARSALSKAKHVSEVSWAVSGFVSREDGESVLALNPKAGGKKALDRSFYEDVKPQLLSLVWDKESLSEFSSTELRWAAPEVFAEIKQRALENSKDQQARQAGEICLRALLGQ